jgi:hypothetical protein
MNNKGAFSVIAALLVAVVLIASVMTAYSSIRYSPVQEQPQILSAVDETNHALKQLLGFTVGYYGSVLKVTGNVNYAYGLARDYLDSGLENVAYVKPEYGLSLNVTDLKLNTSWFTNNSYSQGSMLATYDLNGLGILGISYNASIRLEVQISKATSPTQAQFRILTDNSESLINLGTNNIKFYHYNYQNLTWGFSVPTNIVSYEDGTYLVDLPEGIANNFYVVQIEDTRGLSVTASSSNQINTAIAWNSLTSLINPEESTFMLEILQNGTMRWLGQNMQVTTQTQPIPPVPVKTIHINQTVNGVTEEVPFQIEDWASNYQIPQGLTSNATIFGNRQMIVLLLNSKVSDFTVWWEGTDTATQTPMAFTNRYFINDNTEASTLSNGKITLLFGSFNVKSTVVGSTTSSTTNFMRINQENSTYGAGLSYVIHHGTVRDVVQQEAEWGTGVDGCPNLYANIVLTLPANTTYYTYNLRIMFINSNQARSITDLSPIQLTTTLSSVEQQTENGTLEGFPIVQNGTGTFINSSIGSFTAHHFSQFISDNGKGAGIMFNDKDNQKLYAFDSFPASTSKGALKASTGLIELLPVSSGQVEFNYAYDIAWQGAVVTFDNTTPVYNGTTQAGLWILVENPPVLTVTYSTVSASDSPSVSIAPLSWTMQVGQSKLFTATPAGGSGSYMSYQWYVNGVIQSGQVSSTFDYSPGSTGTKLISAVVIDSLGANSVQSNLVSITVNAALTVSIDPDGTLTMNAGQAQTFTASVSGGTGTKSYQWYLDGGVVPGQTASTYAYTAATSGSPHSVYVRVTDSSSMPESVNSNTVSITVYAQVTFVSAGTGSGTTGNPTPGYPSNMQNGDLILLQVTVRDTTRTPTTPTGFIALYSADSTGTGRQWIYYKFATGSESGSLTVTIGGSVNKMARMYAFRNVALSSFTESESFGSGTGQTINARPVTTNNIARLAVSFAFVNDDNVVASFTGETGGNWDEVVNEYTTTQGSDGCVQLQTATMATASTITGGSYTMAAIDPWGVRAFVLKPR